MPPILPPQDGFLFLDRAKFAASFAGDVGPDEADFMADSQVPWGVDALAARSRSRVEDQAELVPGGHRRQDDSAAAQRSMSKRAGATVVEGPASHAIYVSKPKAVASFIEKAARGKQK